MYFFKHKSFDQKPKIISYNIKFDVVIQTRSSPIQLKSVRLPREFLHLNNRPDDLIKLFSNNCINNFFV